MQQRKVADLSQFKDLPEEIPLPLVIGTKVTGNLLKANKISSQVYFAKILVSHNTLSVHNYSKCKTSKIVLVFC